MWNLLIKAGTILLCTGLVSCTSGEAYKNYTIRMMVEKGADPLASECAIKNDSLTFCVGLLARSNLK